MRRGVTLAELMVALVLGGIVLSSFARSMHVQRRNEAKVTAAQRRASAASEVVRVATAAMSRIATGDAVWIHGDTAIEWRAPLGVALACVAGGDSIVVPDSGSAAWWEFHPDSGDAVELTTAAGSTTIHEIIRVSTRSTGSCGASDRVLYVSGAHNVAGPVAARVMRRIRMVLYRGGDGDWWLGERRCPFEGAVKCSSAQPIGGPLDKPPAGLRFRVDTVGDRHVISAMASSGGVRRSAAVGEGR